MKKIVVTLLAAIIAMAAYAQDGVRNFKPFKTDLALGLVIPYKGIGANYALEPKYAIMDKLAVGFRLEGMSAARDIYITSFMREISSKSVSITSYLATGDYYFSNKVFRPFAGGGLGMYHVGNSGISTSYNSSYPSYFHFRASNKFGGMIRGGFEVRHFRCVADYNIIGNTTYSGDSYGQPAKNGYFTLKVGMFIGGGKYN